MGKKKVGVLAGVVVAVLAAGGIFAFVAANKADAPDSDPINTNVDTEIEGKNSDPATGTSQPEASAEVKSGEVSMNIQNFAYSQPGLVVKKGTKVTWTNQDTARHDVTPDEGKPGAPKSELLGKGESYSFTFNTTGEFSYHCSPHPNMQAKVMVVE